MPNTSTLLLNKALACTMHIDLNSCFAIIEQQANRLLRGKPVGVAAYDTPRGFVLAASYDAKYKGVKLGVNNQQARALCPDITIVTPDPAKYREAHRRFKALLLEFTPDVHPKSIDEFVLNFEASHMLKSRLAAADTHDREAHNQAMQAIALEIKQRIAESLGEYVTVNVGIAPNRFLAKYAAGFGKPDGMLLIDHTNLEKWYQCGVFHECSQDKENCKPMSLVDLPGINVRYKARLRAAGIYTPLDFLHADMQMLKARVFKSINGYHWFRRLRGYEADSVEFERRSIGHQYALKDKTTDMAKLERLLIKLCEKTGRRLRRNDYVATGIHLYLGFDQYRDGYSSDDAYVKKSSSNPMEANEAAGFNTHKFRKWSHGEKVYHRLYSTPDIYAAAKRLLHQAEIPQNVKIMSVHVFGLEPYTPEQLSLFRAGASKVEGQKSRVVDIETSIRSTDAVKRVSDAVDAINDRYGEFVVVPGLMTEMTGEILDRIAFGQVRDM